MTTAEDARKIRVRQRGNALGFLFFKTSLRWFGLKGTYGLRPDWHPDSAWDKGNSKIFTKVRMKVYITQLN
jgi:hypothetical protein